MTKRSYIHRERNLHRIQTALGQYSQAQKAVSGNEIPSITQKSELYLLMTKIYSDNKKGAAFPQRLFIICSSDVLTSRGRP